MVSTTRVKLRPSSHLRREVSSRVRRAPVHVGGHVAIISRMSDTLPVACSLSPEALTARREGLLRDLVTRAESREAHPSGWRLRFPSEPGILTTIARAVDAERQCCRFLRFEIAVEPDGGPISVELSGPTGTTDFLAALLDS